MQTIFVEKIKTHFILGGIFTVTLPRNTVERDICRLKEFGNTYDLFENKKSREKGAKASTVSDEGRIPSSPSNSYTLKISYFKK